jgi:two-component system, NarL family, invasion response regulator UvrY
MVAEPRCIKNWHFEVKKTGFIITFGTFSMTMTSVFLVDDHNLLRNGMAELVAQFDGYRVSGQAANGKEFLNWLELGANPDIIILDVQMPIMDGEQTATWLKKNRPGIKILVLTMYDDERNILKMIRAGVHGYILKDSEPAQLKLALDSIRDYSVYHSDLVTDTLKRVALSDGSPNSQMAIHFTVRELEFIKLACTDLTYKEIAGKMDCGARTVDSYRDEVFAKIGTKSRIGLALFAIKHRLAKVD